jgi:hypothetical protein
VLVSLQRWTPFYWDQERFGMLVPLLALPVRDPLWNLLFQRFLLALAGLGAVILLARHVLAGRDWPLAGALGVAGLIAAAPDRWLFEYLFDQPYGLSLALALVGLAGAEPEGGRPGAVQGQGLQREAAQRVARGALLVVAAHWVSAATGVLLAPLALARAAADLLERADRAEVRSRLARELGLLAVGLVAGQAFLRLAPPVAVSPWRLDLAPLGAGELPAAWATLLGNGWRFGGPWPLALAGAAALGLALLALPALRPGLPGALLRAAALAGAALAWALFAGSLRWVQLNGFHWRYLLPSAVLLQISAAALLAEPLARLRRTARPAALAALALVPAAALAASGPPSLAKVRAELDRAAGRLTPDLLAARCDVLAGSYWTVWPAVWHAALVLSERGERRRVYGLAHRATPTLAAWRDRPGARLCRAAGEGPFADRWLRDYGLPPMRAAARVGVIEVLERDPAPPPPAPGPPPIEPPPPYW